MLFRLSPHPPRVVLQPAAHFPKCLVDSAEGVTALSVRLGLFRFPHRFKLLKTGIQGGIVLHYQLFARNAEVIADVVQTSVLCRRGLRSRRGNS